MGDQVKSLFGVVVRRIILQVSGGAVAAGYLTESDVTTISGAVVTLAMIGYSIWDAKRTNKKLAKL